MKTVKVLVTGASQGIGYACCKKYLDQGFIVHGIDIINTKLKGKNYTHHIADVCTSEKFPSIPGISILVNNAGVQDEANNISINLEGLIAITERYGIQKDIKAIVNIASTSAHNGAEFPNYAASKGGVLSYTKWCAQNVARFGATCNSVSPGGVYTSMNEHIVKNPDMLTDVLRETLLNRWADSSEIAELVYYLSVTNKSITGQDIIIDNGELSKFNFIW